MENDKLKIWLDFSKFFFGTVVIGFISLVVKTGFENREMAIKESDQIGKYVEIALREDVGARMRFAEYFKTVSMSDGYRQRWNAYYEIVNAEFIDTQQKVKNHELKIKALELAIDSIKKQQGSFRVDNVEMLKYEEMLTKEKDDKEEQEHKLTVEPPLIKQFIKAKKNRLSEVERVTPINDITP